jgi:transposase
MNDKHRGGRPRELTQQQADKLLQRITDGDSLASIVEAMNGHLIALSFGELKTMKISTAV